MSSRPLMRGIRPPKALPKNRSSPYAIALTIFVLISAFLLILLALGVFSLPISSPLNSEENQEETHGHHRHRHGRSAAQKSGEGLGERGAQWTEVISWEPRAFVYHNFLSKKECEYLIELAKPNMVKSTVVDSTTGQSKDSRVRTSSGTFLQRGRDKVIRTIEQRIADYTFIPVEHGEGLQILHYEVGQKYEPHFDYFLDDFNTKNGGQRMATVLMYLSDVEEGGETIFPNAKINSSSLSWHDDLSECGKNGLGVRPKAGDALLFYSMKPDATLDPLSLHGLTNQESHQISCCRKVEHRQNKQQFAELSECGKKGLGVRPKDGDALLFYSMKPDATLNPLSLHGGCPVIRGNKWSSTKWMHVHEYKA